MTYSVTELTSYDLEDDDEFWGCNTPQGFVIGSKRNRPCWITYGKVIPVSIDRPRAYTGVTPLTAFVPSTAMAAPHNIDGGPSASYSMRTQGNLWIRESLYRETTDEESNLSAHSVKLTAGTLWYSTDTTQGYRIRVVCKSVHQGDDTTPSGPHRDVNITHRIIHLMYEDEHGVYKAAVKIPYTPVADRGATWTTDWAGDCVTIDLSAEDIVTYPDSPVGDEWSVMPAGATGEFWNQRLVTGRLTPRALDSNIKCDIAEAKISTIGDAAYREGTATLSVTAGTITKGWIQADRYKGIVNEATGEIVAYISRIRSDTVAEVILSTKLGGEPGNDSAKPDLYSVSLTTWHLTGDAVSMYISSISNLGPAGNVRFHQFGYNPVNQLRIDNLYTGGARLERLVRVGEDLVAVFTKGIAVIQGGVHIGDPPAMRNFLPVETMGTVAMNGVWKDGAGALWIWGTKRLLRYASGVVEDASLELGYSRFFTEVFDFGVASQAAVQAQYNPDKNMSLIVGALKVGEVDRVFGAVIKHDANTLHPIRFPRSFTAVGCFLSTSGNWEFWLGGKNRLYLAFQSGTYTDEYYNDAGTLTSAAGIAWKVRTGVHWWGGYGCTKAARLLIETGETSGVDVTLKQDVRRSNIFSGEFSEDTSDSLTHTLQSNKEWVDITNKTGWGVQYELSGTSNAKMTLIALVVAEDVEEIRGWKELSK